MVIEALVAELAPKKINETPSDFLVPFDPTTTLRVFWSQSNSKALSYIFTESHSLPVPISHQRLTRPFAEIEFNLIYRPTTNPEELELYVVGVELNQKRKETLATTRFDISLNVTGHRDGSGMQLSYDEDGSSKVIAVTDFGLDLRHQVTAYSLEETLGRWGQIMAAWEVIQL